MKKIGFALLTSAMIFGMVGCSNNKSSESDGTKDKTITFATAPDTAPFTYKEGGKLKGFDIELVNEIAKEKGYKVKWEELKFNGIIPGLQAKKFDGAVAAITIKPERKEVVNFADPYFESGLVLVSKSDGKITKLEDLKGKTIVAKLGSSGEAKAKELATKYGAKVKTLEDEATLYLDVLNGGSDALINDYPFVAYKINSGTAKGLQIVGQKLTGEDYGIALSKGNDQLLKDFNKELKELKENGEYDKLHKKYFGN